MNNHNLEIEANVLGMGYEGHCKCSDFDYEDGWHGGTVFFGGIRDIKDQHHDHLVDVGALV